MEEKDQDTQYGENKSNRDVPIAAERAQGFRREPGHQEDTESVAVSDQEARRVRGVPPQTLTFCNSPCVY